jgi:hypothetical protein
LASFSPESGLGTADFEVLPKFSLFAPVLSLRFIRCLEYCSMLLYFADFAAFLISWTAS